MRWAVLSLLALMIPALMAQTQLQDGQPVSGLSGATGTNKFYYITVPANATALTLNISGGSGDADLYVRQGSAPTTTSYDCRPYLSGNNETCSFNNPAAGNWHVMVRAYSTYSNLTLTADYELSSGGGSGELSAGVPVTGLAGSQGSQQFFYIDLPAGASNLAFTTSGGSGDADLYVRFGAQPTNSAYDCRPYLSGNAETCSFATPQAGRYYVRLYAYSTFSGVTLTASFDGGGGGGTCVDVDGGITVQHLGNGNVTTLTYSSWIRTTGSISSGFDLSICDQPDYGLITFSGNPIPIGGGFDNSFTFNYTHLGSRPSNSDSFSVKVTSGSVTSVKTFNLTLSNPIVEHPVQGPCGNIDIDNDHDGIPDCAEVAGNTFYGMPLYAWGARQNQNDIFIEVDYMPVHTLRDYDGNVVTDSQGNPIQDHGTQPLRESLDRVKALYAARGYSIHFDIGDLYDKSPGLDPADHDLGGGQAVPFNEYVHLNRWTDTYNGRTINVPGMTEDFMPQYFENNPERKRIFYYLLFANSQGGSNRGSSGQAPDTFDYWFYLSMGGTGWRLNDDTPANRNMLINAHASTIFHELGHVVGFSHGGNPETTTKNFKPNYLSSMNYLFQLQGVPADFFDISAEEMIMDRYQLNWGYREIGICHDRLQERRPDNYTWGNLLHGLVDDPADFNITYSDGAYSPINEASLSESGTLGGVDFDCDNFVSTNTRSFDINFDGSTDTLLDYNDWGNLHTYYRYLNYSNGKYLISPNTRAKNAWWPSQAFDGAPMPALNKAAHPGIEEMVLPPEAFEALHLLQQR